MKFTSRLPKKEGFYWFTNFGEHTPTIVEVKRENGVLYAFNEEFTIRVKKINVKKNKEECLKLEMEPIDGHYYGEQMWCYIPVPTMHGKKITPDCY